MLVLANVAPILNDLGLAIVTAAALAFVARATRQPLILAYVAAGVLLGKSMGLGRISDPESIDAIASLGLILLLYLIGLEIDLKALKRSGSAVLWTGLLQAPLNAAICLLVPWALSAMGWADDLGRYGALYLAVALSLSSTLVVVKVLYDKMELDTLPGRLTLGVLVFQDLWAILFLAVQPSLAAPEVGPLLTSLGLGVAIVVGAFLAARYLLPPLFRSAARSPELVVLGALAWCFLIAGLASKAGLSAETGALVAGLSMSVLPYRLDVVAKVTTVRDFFLTLFFVSLGLRVAAPTPSGSVIALVVAVFVLLSRFVVLFPLIRRLGLGDRVALVVPMNLWPISEFSLVLTALGLHYGHVGPLVLQAVLFSMILTAVAGTYLILASHAVYGRLARLLARLGWARDGDVAESHAHGHEPHALVLLGFHRIASALLEELTRTQPELLAQVHVVDFNPVVLRALQARGVSCAYGDLASPDTLRHAGIEGARVVACTIPDTLLKGTSNARLYEHVRGLVPEAAIVATAETPAAERLLREKGAGAILVPARSAGTAALADLVALLAGSPAPSSVGLGSPRDEILG